MTRRVVGGALLAAVLLVVLAVVGRWEGRRETAGELRGIERVRAAVGSIDSSSLSSIRRSPGYTCLAYRRGANSTALELCYGLENRVYEASDRRTIPTKVYSLRLDPSAASLRLPNAQVAAAEHRIVYSFGRSIWRGPVQYFDSCAAIAAIARRVGSARQITAARVLCQSAASAVAANTASAEAALLSMVESASAGIDGVIDGYVAALRLLPGHPSTYDARRRALDARAARIQTALRHQAPWIGSGSTLRFAP